MPEAVVRPLAAVAPPFAGLVLRALDALDARALAAAGARRFEAPDPRAAVVLVLAGMP